MIYTINGASYSSDYLAHYNIPGAKWGHRRWQYKDGSLTPEGKLRYLKGGDKSTGARHKPSAAKEAHNQEEEKAKREQYKKDILQTGTAKQILEIKDMLTRSEMEEAKLRLDSISNLQQLAAKEPHKLSRGEKIDRFMKRIDKAREWVDIGTKAYNSAAVVVNGWSKEPWPILDKDRRLGLKENQQKTDDKKSDGKDQKKDNKK